MASNSEDGELGGNSADCVTEPEPMDSTVADILNSESSVQISDQLVESVITTHDVENMPQTAQDNKSDNGQNQDDKKIILVKQFQTKQGDDSQTGSGDAPSTSTDVGGTGDSRTGDGKSSKYRRHELVDEEGTSDDTWPRSVPAEQASITDEVDLSQLSYSSSSTPSSSSSSDADSQQESYETTFRSKKRPSNASSDAEDEKILNSVMSKDKPKHKWFVVQEVVNRQKGYSSRYHDIDLFRQRCYSSLHTVQRLELMYKLDNHDGCVNTLHFNSSGSLLASGSDDLTIVLWKWASGRPAVKYKSGHRSNVFQAKFLPFSGDTHIVSCSRDGQVRLAEMSSEGVCRSTKKLATHCGAVHKLAVQCETPHVFLSCAEDAQVFSIDVREEAPNKILCVKEEQRKIPLYGIHSNPINNNEFCVNGRNNYIRIYDKRRIEADKMSLPLKQFCPHHLMFAKSSTQVTSAVFSYDGSEIIGSYNDEDIYLFRTTIGEETNYKYKYEGHRNNMTVKGVNFFGPKSEYIVSGSDCGNIFFWDKPTQAIVQWMPGDEGGVVNCLEPHPHVPAIATSGLDNDVKIWVPSNEQEPTMDGLREAMFDNFKSRESDRQPRPDSDGQNTLMILWRRHMRRAQRRRQEHAARNAAAGTEANESPPSPSSDDSADDDTNFERCSPS